MVDVMMTKIIVGRIIGTVMAQNRRMRPAPSRAADSYTSRGMACIAARRMSALYPVQRQLTMLEIAMWLGNWS